MELKHECQEHPLAISADMVRKIRKMRRRWKIPKSDWEVVEKIILEYNHMVGMAASPGQSPIWQSYGWGEACALMMLLIWYLRKLIDDYGGKKVGAGLWNIDESVDSLREFPGAIIDQVVQLEKAFNRK